MTATVQTKQLLTVFEQQPSILTSIMERHETPNLFQILDSHESRTEQLHRKLRDNLEYQTYVQRNGARCRCGNRRGHCDVWNPIAGPKGYLPK